MRFAKWFGGRDTSDDTDEPARAAAPPATRPDRPGARAARVASETKSHVKKGFDPYNSGAFERHNAWERVGRR